MIAETSSLPRYYSYAFCDSLLYSFLFSIFGLASSFSSFRSHVHPIEVLSSCTLALA